MQNAKLFPCHILKKRDKCITYATAHCIEENFNILQMTKSNTVPVIKLTRAYLQQRVSMLQKPAHHSMACLMVSDSGFLSRLQNPRLLFQTSDHPLYSLLKVSGGHGRAEVPRRDESRFITHVCNVGS